MENISLLGPGSTLVPAGSHCLVCLTEPVPACPRATPRPRTEPPSPPLLEWQLQHVCFVFSFPKVAGCSCQSSFLGECHVWRCRAALFIVQGATVEDPDHSRSFGLFQGPPDTWQQENIFALQVFHSWMAWRAPVLTPLLGHCQGQQFPALLTDPTLSGQGATGSPQVILVSHTSQAPSATCEEITYQVPGHGVQETVAPTSFLPGAVLVVVSPAPNPVFCMASASHRGFSLWPEEAADQGLGRSGTHPLYISSQPLWPPGHRCGCQPGSRWVCREGGSATAML